MSSRVKGLKSSSEDEDIDSREANFAVHPALKLPEILDNIFRNLSVADIGRAAQVCANWRDASNHPSAWRSATCRLSPDTSVPAATLKRLRIRKYEIFQLESTPFRCWLRELLESLKDVESLKFIGGDQMTEAILLDTLPVFQQLRMTTLNLCDCDELTDVSVDLISNTMPNLVSLDMGYSRLSIEFTGSLTDKSLLLIAIRLPKLKRLHFSLMRNQLTDRGVGYLVGQIDFRDPTIRSLLRSPGVSGTTTINQNATHQVGRGLKIVSLCLSGCWELKNEALKLLSGLTELEQLDVSFCDIGDNGLAHLSKMTSLRVLKLRECQWVTNLGLEHLAKMSPGLLELNLNHCCSISHIGILSLAKSCLNMTSLDIASCHWIGRKGLQCVAGGLPNLRSLWLDPWNIDLHGFNLAIENLPHLNGINVGGLFGGRWRNCFHKIRKTPLGRRDKKVAKYIRHFRLRFFQPQLPTFL